MKKLLFLFILSLFTFAITASAQPRPMDKSSDKEEAVKPAPDVIETKYKGGLFGFDKSEQGTLKFDDINERLVFYGEDGKEKFSINYAVMQVVYPSTKKVQSGGGRAVSAIPLPGAGIGGMFMKKKKNYLIIQFRDPQVDFQGAVNFIIDTGDLLKSVVYTLGEKAEMTRRGDAFYRPRKLSATDDN